MTSKKIKTVAELADIVRRLRGEKKTVVQCHGTFDLMHPGHIYHFRAAKQQGDVLIVTVTPDVFVKKGPGRPVFNEQLRLESIAAIEFVDYVALDIDPKPLKTIALLKPDVFVKGGDYAGKELESGHPSWEEKQLVDSYGGRYHFTNEPVVFSSSQLLNEHFSPFPEETQEFLRAIRGKYPFESIRGIFERVKNVKVLVIGDTILDVYHYCDALGRSVKEEIQRVKVNESEMFAGGSVAVANTMAGFCDTVGLLTLLGKKDAEKEKKQEAFIRDALQSNVKTHFYYRADAPTVVNERFASKAFLKKYFGIYQMDDRPLDGALENELVEAFQKIIPQYDMVVVMDYGLGMMTERLIKEVAEKSKFLAVNTQTNSANMGFNFIDKYPRADYLGVSQPELRMAFHARYTPLEQLMETAAKNLKARVISLTLASRGAILYDRAQYHLIPVFSQKITDRIGAGDAYLSVTAPCVFLGDVPTELIGFLGNAAGAIACTIVANRETVDRAMFLRFIQTLLK